MVNHGGVKVAIADDHPMIRKRVRQLLEALPEITIVGEAGDGKAALELVEKMAPDILVLDIQMPGMDGIEVIKKLTQQGTAIFILVLSGIDDPMFIREILSMGACRYVIKGDISNINKNIQLMLMGKCQNDPPSFAP